MDTIFWNDAYKRPIKIGCTVAYNDGIYTSIGKVIGFTERGKIRIMHTGPNDGKTYPDYKTTKYPGSLVII